MQVRVLFVPVGIWRGKERLEKSNALCTISNFFFFFTQAHCNSVLEVALSELSAVLHCELEVNTTIYADTILLVILWKLG